MTVETGILLIAILLGTAGFGFSLACRRKLTKHRELFEFAEKQILELQESLSKNKEAFDTNANRIAEQSRRIAWLETRVRQPKPAGDEILDEAAAESSKPNMTERRHRVITLASRGQNVESIASALGILPGEVELIINLNQAAANHK